jgi:hypothetical protein
VKIAAEYQELFPLGTGFALQRFAKLKTGETAESAFLCCRIGRASGETVWTGSVKFFQANCMSHTLCDYMIYFALDADGKCIRLDEGYASVELGVEVTRRRHFIPSTKEVWKVETAIEKLDQVLDDAHSALAHRKTFEIPADHPLRRQVTATAIRVLPSLRDDERGRPR